MEESEDNMSAEEIRFDDAHIKNKPKKRSIVERELETSLTARVTSPLTNGGATSTSRYGRARRLKSDADIYDSEKNLSRVHKSPKFDRSPSKSAAYKMHASNSPIRIETPQCDVTLENQIENIYNENVSLSRFGSEEKSCKTATKKIPKVYIRKDLIQSKEKEDDTVVLIKNMFSPSESGKKSNTHLSNYMERSSEKYNLNKTNNGYLNTSSVVKTLDFDGKKKRRDEKKMVLSKSELFNLEAQCEYQVGDLAWARMGTYPFWPCIITRDPLSGTFVKKKLYGRIERDVLHVTFFGDNGRRGWIVGTMLRKFLGQMEFEVARNNFPLEAKKKDPRLYAAFFISDKKMPQWQVSVEEAEILLKEPKRLRIDILYEMLQKGKEIKTTPKHEKSKKIVRTNSDVSLSESLLDTLFSEDDTTGKDIERSRSKSGNRSLDVSDVVTACLDNMAAKTGITKIQKQSHMDRWLQKAKSKTPEKSHLQSHLSLKIEKDNKVSNTAKLKKKLPKKSPPNKSCNFRKNIPESQYEIENKLLSHQNEHDYSLRYRGNNGPAILDDIEIEYENAEIFTSDIIEPGSGLGIISKVETLYGRDQTQNNDQSDKIMTVSTDKFILSDTNNIENTNIEKHVCIYNNQAQSLDFRNDLICESVIDSPSQYDTKETEIRKINSKIKPIKIETEVFIQATNPEKSGKKSETIPRDLKEVDCNKSNHYALDDTSMDSGSMEVCESHIKAMNHACDPIENRLAITTIEQNMSQIGPTLQTKVELNYGSNLPNISIKTLELKNVTSQNKGSNNFTENDPPTNVSSNVEKGIENFCNVSSSIIDKTPSAIRDNLIQKKGLDLNYLNNAKKIRIQNSNVIGMKDYIGDGNEEISDISKNFGEKKIKGKAIPNKKTAKEANLVLNNELELNNLNPENKFTNISLKSSNAPIIDDIKEYADEGIVDLADVSTTAGDNNKMMEKISLRQTNLNKPCHVNNRHNDLKEFETQLYNIFGLSNKKSPKSKLNLSLKSSNNNNIIDEKKTIDAGVININKEQSESNQSTMKNKNMYVDSKITNVLVSILEVDPTESKIISQENHSGKKCADINSSRKNNIVNEADFLDLQNETVETDCNEDKLISSKASIDLVDSDTNNIEKRELLTAYDESSKYRHAKTISDSITERNEIVGQVAETTVDMVNNGPIKNKVYTIEINSSEQTTSPQKIKSPSDNKLSYDIRKALQNSDFLKYVELKQDALMDEQPALTEMDVTNYLYKTWLYEEGLKTDIKKTDDIQNAKLVNGLKQSPIKIKLSLNKTSKNNKKTYNVQITNDNENFHSSSVRIFGKNSNKNDYNTKNKKINDDCANQSDLSLKKSKRVKRNSHYNSSFQKYFNSNTEKESYSSKVPELASNESCVIRSGLCPIVIKENITKEAKSAEDSKTVSSSKSLTQNCFINDQTHKQLHSCSKSDKLLPKVSEPVTLNGEYEGNLEKTSLDDSDSNTSGDEEEPLADQLRLSISKNQSAYVADGDINMKKMDIIEEKNETEKDDTDTSVKSDDSEISFKNKSEDSEISFNNKNFHTTQHLSNDTREALKNQDFLKYLELKQDTVIDEHPELTEKEVTNYLYKTWLFEESLKNDIKKADDIETVTNMVKGLYQEAAPVKRVRKKKLEKDKQIAFNLDSQDIPRKEKSKRKIIKQYFYKENFSDIEDDVELFEIFKPKSKTPTPIKPFNKDTIQIETAERSSNTQMIDAVNEFVTDELDEVEEYFRQLTAPKPNLFKGLIREKLCEICEKGYNLIKCKGCYCMFHVDCVKKKTELVEVASSVRGRKKKKKSRGRKPKDQTNSLDFECQNDERSQDPNASDEMLNTSIENDIEPYVIANADDFETQLSLQMKALLENPDNNMENDSYSSAEELDWNDIDYGQCKIVDVLPRKKDRGNDIDYSNFKCNDCQKYGTPVCFVCKTAVSPKDKAEHRQRCQVAHCQKYYHSECLNHWPQTQFNAGELSRISNSSKLVEALTCPRHVCHTCVCDDPRGCKTRFSGDKLARCVRCPATYHTFTKCLPAGTQILTASHIICPRHYEHRPGTQPRHVNTGWCFICALGGTLICCEYCPTSFHAECLNIDPPEGGYMCEDCETGRLPLYGEMVWVKLGHYRWWPGIILHPSEIPLNIQAVKHSQGEFVVRFFGQYDYYWVNRGRVFPFQEGDSGRITNQKSKIDAAFTMAMEHAQRACEILKTASPNEVESMDIASSLLPPHYVKLKVNKPCGSLCGKKIDIEESSLTQCECDPNEIDPCGPYTQCLNRMLLTECGPTCRTGDRCNNRAFEKRLYPKMTPYRTPARGWGLKVLEDIKAGQFVIEYVGELIDEEEFKRRMRRKQEVRDENFYYLTLDKERMIDAGPKGNLARFMNHSCEPNCETQKWTVLGDVRVGLFAIYDIPANSELTFNYNLESTGIEKKPCMCGAKRCSGYIGEKPKQDDQPKKSKPGMPTKRTYKKRKNVEVSPYTKPKQRVGRPHKPRELTEIEKDLLIIKNATSGMSSDSESSSLLSIDSKDSKGLKRKRTDDVFSPSTKKYKAEQNS